MNKQGLKLIRELIKAAEKVGRSSGFAMGCNQIPDEWGKEQKTRRKKLKDCLKRVKEEFDL